MEHILEKVDTDGDRSISIPEAIAAFKKMTKGMPNKLKAKLFKKAKKYFNDADIDDNGEVDAKELHDAIDKHMGKND